MFLLKVSLVLINIALVTCLRNPKDVEYLEKKTFVPSLEDLQVGKKNIFSSTSSFN